MSNSSATRQELIRLLNEVDKLNKGDASKNKCDPHFPNVLSPSHQPRSLAPLRGVGGKAPSRPDFLPPKGVVSRIPQDLRWTTPTYRSLREYTDGVVPFRPPLHAQKIGNLVSFLESRTKRAMLEAEDWKDISIEVLDYLEGSEDHKKGAVVGQLVLAV